MAQMISVREETTVTAAGGGPLVDISLLDTKLIGSDAGLDWTAVVEVTKSGPDTKAILQFNDTVQGALLPPIEAPSGINNKTPWRVSFRQHDYPGQVLGITSQSIQLNLIKISGTNPTITYRAWLEI